MQLTRWGVEQDAPPRTSTVGLDRDRLRAVLPLLSRRQREIAQLLLEGCPRREIARRTGLARTTVHDYIERIAVIMAR